MPKPDTVEPEEQERQGKAIELRIAGATYDQIAKALGYADRSGAHCAVNAVLKRRESAQAAELRALEDERLDLALRKVTPGVVAGDLRAVEMLLRIHDRRVKLHGLAAPERVLLGGMDQGTFETTVAQDLKELGIDPKARRPVLEPEPDDDWANT